ncbi:MAG: oleate hydratase [Hyphomicrobiales bacterium]
MAKSEQKANHHIIGAGIAGLATAVFLIRDAGIKGGNIKIYEQSEKKGGSLDGSGDKTEGYLVRGGRMFEEHFVCTFNLLSSIPSADNLDISIFEDIQSFNKMVPGRSSCRIVRGAQPAPDRYSLGLSKHDTLNIVRLLLRSEGSLYEKSIDDWFSAAFFESNFWLMWSTMFSFQPWHSLVEMRRYLRRFIHLFPGFTRVAGILRTRYNQYDSIIAPIVAWLGERGVEIATNSQIVDANITEALSGDRLITSLIKLNGEVINTSEADRVYFTLGSMTEGSTIGSNSMATNLDDRSGGAWSLWETLAGKYSGFGNPDSFCGNPSKTAWNSFTVTLESSALLDFMEEFTGNRTGTGGIITFADSSWILSIVMFHQPHFKTQNRGSYIFWGYGLRGDRCGDFVDVSMWQATGDQILVELLGHLGLSENGKDYFSKAKIRLSRMPFITSQFLVRDRDDRPEVIPAGAQNFAVIGQYCELPIDCVFTVEYSVRSAWTAVRKLTGAIDMPPNVVRNDLNPAVIWRAAKVLMKS